MNCKVWKIDSKNERQTHQRLNVRCQRVCHDWVCFGKLIWDWFWQKLNDTELWWLEQQFRSLEFCRHPAHNLQGTHGCQSWESIMLDIELGVRLTNVQSMEKKLRSNPLAHWFCLLSPVFPYLAQLVEHCARILPRSQVQFPGNRWYTSKSPLM